MVPGAVTEGAAVFVPASALTASVKPVIWTSEPFHPAGRSEAARLAGRPAMVTVAICRLALVRTSPSAPDWRSRFVYEFAGVVEASIDARLMSPSGEPFGVMSRVADIAVACRTLEAPQGCWSTWLPVSGQGATGLASPAVVVLVVSPGSPVLGLSDSTVLLLPLADTVDPELVTVVVE